MLTWLPKLVTVLPSTYQRQHMRPKLTSTQDQEHRALGQAPCSQWDVRWAAVQPRTHQTPELRYVYALAASTVHSSGRLRTCHRLLSNNHGHCVGDEIELASSCGGDGSFGLHCHLCRTEFLSAQTYACPALRAGTLSGPLSLMSFLTWDERTQGRHTGTGGSMSAAT
jgi:hypothetical protein